MKNNTNRDKRVRQPRGAGSPFCPGWCYQPGQKGAFCPGCQTRDKRAPLLSRTGVPGWETGTTGVSQPGQINVFVVVRFRWLSTGTTMMSTLCTLGTWRSSYLGKSYSLFFCSSKVTLLADINNAVCRRQESATGILL